MSNLDGIYDCLLEREGKEERKNSELCKVQV